MNSRLVCVLSAKSHPIRDDSLGILRGDPLNKERRDYAHR